MKLLKLPSFLRYFCRIMSIPLFNFFLKMCNKLQISKNIKFSFNIFLDSIFPYKIKLPNSIFLVHQLHIVHCFVVPTVNVLMMQRFRSSCPFAVLSIKLLRNLYLEDSWLTNEINVSPYIQLDDRFVLNHINTVDKNL